MPEASAVTVFNNMVRRFPLNVFFSHPRVSAVEALKAVHIGQIMICIICCHEMLCRICVVQIQPGNHVLAQSDHPGVTQQPDLQGMQILYRPGSVRPGKYVRP